MRFKKWRVRTFDSKGIILEHTFWTQGGALTYLHNWVKWYVKRCEFEPLSDPALYLEIHHWIAGEWIPFHVRGHYQYVNDLIGEGVIV